LVSVRRWVGGLALRRKEVVDWSYGRPPQHHASIR
jgi:hypothetical protein